MTEVPPPPLVYFTELLLFVSIVVNISPEIGIAFSITLFVSFTVKALVHRNILQFAYGITSLLSSAIWFIVIPGMLDAFSSFASGGLNWPFIICYSLIFFFGTVFIFAFHIGRQLKDFKNNIDLMTIELMAAALIPAALGRCDPGHLLWDGLMLIIITAALLCRNVKHSRLFAVAVIIFILNLVPFVIRFIVIPNYSWAAKSAIKTVIQNNDAIKKIIFTDSGKAFVSSAAKIFGISEDKVFSKLSGEQTEAPKILQDISDVSMPFGGGNALYIYLTDNNKYHYLPYKGTQGSYQAINQNLNALIQEKPKYILLYDNWDKSANASDPASFINILFMTYYSRSRIYNSNEILRATIDYIKEAYEYVDEVEYFGIISLYKLRPRQ